MRSSEAAKFIELITDMQASLVRIQALQKIYNLPANGVVTSTGKCVYAEQETLSIKGALRNLSNVYSEEFTRTYEGKNEEA